MKTTTYPYAFACSAALLAASCERAAVPTTPAPMVEPPDAYAHYATEPLRPNGTYEVEQLRDGTFHVLGRTAQDEFFREAELALDPTTWRGPDTEIAVRVHKVTGFAAHLDAVSLGDAKLLRVSAEDLEVEQAATLVRKLSARDFDVAELPREPLTLVFTRPKAAAPLRVTARIEAERICNTPFHFPLENGSAPLQRDSKYFSYRLGSSPGALVVDGALDEVSDARPFMREFAKAGTGHPSDDVLAWVRDDGERLYVAIDFTGDNTLDGGKDYAAVYVNTPQGVREYKVTAEDSRHGIAGFGYSKAVGYAHKLYEISIALAELGTASLETLQLAFGTYGTCSPCLCEYGTNFDIRRSCCPPDEMDIDGLCCDTELAADGTCLPPRGPVFDINLLEHSGFDEHITDVGAGLAVGTSNFPGNSYATAWRPSSSSHRLALMTTDDFAQSVVSHAFGINDSGYVVGWRYWDDGLGNLYSRAFLLTPEGSSVSPYDQDLDPTHYITQNLQSYAPNLNTMELMQMYEVGNSFAAAINNADPPQSAGSTVSGPYMVPARWDGTSLTVLPGMDVTNRGAALAINDDGVAAGYAVDVVQVACGEELCDVDVEHPVIWDGNTLLDLGVQCPTCSGRAVDINNNGWVAGYTYLAGSPDPYAFVYIPFVPPPGMQSGMNIIGIGPTMIGGNSYFGSAAYFQTIGINDLGQIVGTVMEDGSPRGFIRLPEPAFDIEAGTYYLDDLIGQISGGANDGLSTHIVGWTVDISNSGTIIAHSFRRNPSAGDNEYYLGLQRSSYRPYDSLPYIDDLFVPVVIDPDFTVEDGDPVNTFSGELILREEPDLAVGPLKLERFYAGRLEERAPGPTPLGPGWRHLFQWTLTRDDSGDAPLITVISPEGSRVELVQQEGDWVARAADGTGYQLAEIEGGYEVVTPVPQRLMRFDDQGRLVGTESSEGYVQTLSYTGELLASVSDSFGNALALSYDENDQLESVSDGARTVGFAYDAPGEPLRFVTDVLGHETEYTYDGALRMTAKILPKGEAHLTQGYDGEGRVISQTDADSHVTQLDYDYDDIAYRTARIDPAGHMRVHQYTRWGRLLTTHDESGYETQFHYDDEYGGERYGTGLGLDTELEYRNDPVSGRPMSSLDVEGGYTEHTYESSAWGNLTRNDRVQTTYADGTYDTASYDRQAGGTTVTLTDRAGVSSTLMLDAVGQVVSSENPLGGVTAYSYYGDGSLQSVTSPAGDTTALAHAADATTLVTTMTYADDAQVVLTYDAQRKLIERREVPADPLSDADAHEHSYTYDDNGNLESSTDPLGNTALYSFDAMDRLTAFVDAAGHTHSIEYDSRGLVSRVVDGSGVEMLFEHDEKGQLAAMVDAHGLRWEMEYDHRGRVISRAAPESQAVSYEYDEGARQLRMTDPLGATTTLSYDEMGRVRSMEDGEGALTCYEYDARGLLTSATLPSAELSEPCEDRAALDPELAITAQYAWNDASLLQSVIDPNEQAWGRGYDAAGRLTSTVDPNAHATTYGYDERDRLTSVAYPNGDEALLSYDGYGRVARRVYSAEGASDETFDFTYDALGRIESVNDESFEYDGNGVLTAGSGFEYTSDGAGRLLTVAIDDGKVVTYVYDEGRLSAVQDWLGGEVTFGYDDHGRLHQVARTNGVTTTYAYDELDRITSIAEATNDPLAETALEYAPSGRVSQVTRTQHAQALPALVSPTPRTVDAASQLEGFTYDERGRPTLADGRSYAWSASGRLASYTEDAQTVSFVYDAYGSVVTRTVGASTTTYRHSYAHALPCPMERNADGEITYYVCTPDGELLYGIAAASGARHFFHFDESGNTRLVTDGDASVIATYAYLPFGERAGGGVTPGFDNPFTFSGRFGAIEEGESGLFHMRKRVYDSRTQRFLTRDPLEQQLEPRILNPYQYAANDPISFVDPLGAIPTPVKYDGTTADAVVDKALKYNTNVTYVVKEGATALADSLAQEARLVRKFAPPSALKDVALDKLWTNVGKLDKVADFADKAGTAGDVLGSALEGYKTAEKLNGIHAETLSCQDLALRTLDNQLGALNRSVKDGRISTCRGAELAREFSSQFDAALAQCESRSWIDTAITSLEGFKNTLAGITPAPVQHGLSAFETGVQKLGNSRNPFVFVRR